MLRIFGVKSLEMNFCVTWALMQYQKCEIPWVTKHETLKFQTLKYTQRVTFNYTFL